MKSPKDMKIIQIDITNACVHTCSNCTRFCGHHKNVFFMNYQTFQQAVDSLDGYKGIVGIIGGEPTIHPEFEKFSDYIKIKRVTDKVRHLYKPQSDMLAYIRDNMWHEDAKAGLWSSLSKGYYKYFEVINDTFKTQLLNDHNNTCMHQALLMARHELGISDDVWIKKRDACWIQNTWSATITPKGAFFCEVAGALDMLFNGPGGWKVEPGWFERAPDEFEDQLHWCELCSACIDVPKRISNDGRDDVTPMLYRKLQEIGSPKAAKGMCVVHKPESYDSSKYKTFTGANDYMDAGNNQRTSRENLNLYPKEFVVVQYDNLQEILEKQNPKDWILIGNDEKYIEDAKAYFHDVIINPGCLYIYEDEVVAINVMARSIRELLKKPEKLEQAIWGFYSMDKIIKINAGEKRKLEEVIAHMNDLESAANQLKIIERFLPYKSKRRNFVKFIVEKILDR